MESEKKAVFLPANNLILDNYKGYVDGKIARPDLKEKDVWRIIKKFAPELKNNKYDRYWAVPMLILFSPIIMIVYLLTKFFKSTEWVGYKFFYNFQRLFYFIRNRKPNIWTSRQKRRGMDNIEEENIPAFLEMCNNRIVDVYLYSFKPLSILEDEKLNALIANTLVKSCQVLNRLLDLKEFIEREKISIINSTLVITDSNEVSEAESLGFYCDHRKYSLVNIYLWGVFVPKTSKDIYIHSSRRTLNVFASHIVPQGEREVVEYNISGTFAAFQNSYMPF